MDDEEENNRRCGGVFFGRTGLFVVMTSYALLGAVLFRFLEGGEDADVPSYVQKSREDCLKELWLITERLNVLYERNWTQLVTEQLKRFERSVIESGSLSDEPMNQWTFGGALLYSLALLTTVGYGRLSPRTSLGKIVTMIYATVGVPLMLLLLSALGTLLANGAKSCYTKLRCRRSYQSPTVGYYKAPCSPKSCRLHEDAALVQIGSSPTNCNEVPKRALLATVRSSHSRGRCRGLQVKQTLAEAGARPQHGHANPLRAVAVNSCGSDLEEADEAEDGELSHDTPSRVPLIHRRPSPPPPRPPAPASVPAAAALLLFATYVCLGATAFAASFGWDALDAVYFCFVAVSTIAVGDAPGGGGDEEYLCCLYLFVGLAVTAMCFSLVHEEVNSRCRQFAGSVRFSRHS